MSPFSTLVRSSFVLCLLFVSTFQHEDVHEDQQELDVHKLSKSNLLPLEVNKDIQKDHHGQVNDLLSSGGKDQIVNSRDEFESGHIAQVSKEEDKKHKKPKEDKKHKEEKKPKESKKEKESQKEKESKKEKEAQKEKESKKHKEPKEHKESKEDKNPKKEKCKDEKNDHVSHPQPQHEPHEPQLAPHEQQPAPHEPQEPQLAPHEPQPEPHEPQEPHEPHEPQESQPAPHEPQQPQPAPHELQQPQPTPQEPQPAPHEPQATPQEPQAAPQEPQPAPQEPQPAAQQLALPPGQFIETNFAGAWEMANQDVGVSAMHLQLLPNNKLIMFDATSLGKSNIELPPNNCRIDPNKNIPDCWAHSVEFDPLTNVARVLKVITDPWCSSGGLAPDGTLIGTGGWKDGGRTIRYMPPCDGCDWRESNIKLWDERWYGTQVLLGDGRFVIFGGRRAFGYEFLAPENIPAPPKVDLPFLRDTTDIYENNLYPFAHLLPNGNVFLFANTKAIQLDVRTNTIVKNYPDLPGGARNYPGSGSATILPIDLRKFIDQNLVDIEILICGGGEPLAFGKAEKENLYLPALDSCGKIKALDPAPQWEMDKMLTPRVMGDMLNLPNGQILMLNGAKKGASGWLFADDPNLEPLLYDPSKPLGQRFKNLAPTTIARMYHSTSALLPDGKILVAGSNTNPMYQFVNVKFPTEVRVEKFSPPYMDAQLDNVRPNLMAGSVTKQVKYNGEIALEFKVINNNNQEVKQEDVMISIYQPPFTTHGYSQNQRLLILPVVSFESQNGQCKMKVTAPAKSDLAPPCYYLLFVNHKGVPSQAAWIQLQL